MKISSSALYWIAIALTTLPAVAQKPVIGEWMHPKVKARELTIKSLVVLPSQFVMSKDTMKGRQSLENENMRYSPIIDRAIMTALGNSGVAVSPGSPTEASMSSSPEVRGSVASLQKEFDSVTPTMFKKKGDVKKGRFKVNEDALSGLGVKDLTANDAVLFVRGYGTRQTKSKAFASGGGLIGMAFAGGLNVNMIFTFVDAVTGEVLFMKGIVVSVKDENTEQRLVKDIGNWLKGDGKKVFGKV